MDIITINDYSKMILDNYYEEFMHKFSDAITYNYNKHVIKTKVLYNKTKNNSVEYKIYDQLIKMNDGTLFLCHVVFTSGYVNVNSNGIDTFKYNYFVTILAHSDITVDEFLKD